MSFLRITGIHCQNFQIPNVQSSQEISFLFFLSLFYPDLAARGCQEGATVDLPTFCPLRLHSIPSLTTSPLTSVGHLFDPD